MNNGRKKTFLGAPRTVGVSAFFTFHFYDPFGLSPGGGGTAHTSGGHQVNRRDPRPGSNDFLR